MVLAHAKNIALSVTNMTLGGCFAGLTTMFITWARPRIVYIWKYFIIKVPHSRKVLPKQYWSFLILVDALLAGMVAMCSGTFFIILYYHRYKPEV